MQNIIAKNRHFRHRLEIEVEEEGNHHVAAGEMRLAENTALHTLRCCRDFLVVKILTLGAGGWAADDPSQTGRHQQLDSDPASVRNWAFRVTGVNRRRVG
jgi:hypothetical protein